MCAGFGWSYGHYCQYGVYSITPVCQVLACQVENIAKLHSNKLSTVQIGIQLCQTDPRLSSRFSTLNPRADIDRWDFHSVRLFTVEIWLE